MSKRSSLSLLLCLPTFFLFAHLFHASLADLGTASQYSPPYTPTECYGSDATQFPSSNFFAAAGEGIWDNGAACGRQYLISCINSILPRACKHGETIQIKIVDRAQTALSKPTKQGTTMVLSNAALAAIADPNAPSLNIDFRQKFQHNIPEIGAPVYEVPAYYAGPIYYAGTLTRRNFQHNILEIGTPVYELPAYYAGLGLEINVAAGFGSHILYISRI